MVRLSARFTRRDRDQVVQALTAAGIGSRAYFPPIHLQPLYAPYLAAPADLGVTENVASRTLALPFFNALTKEDVLQVCQALGEAIGGLSRRAPQNVEGIPI